MSLKIHAFVQYANDEDSLSIWDEEDHMGLMSEAPQIWGEFIGTAAVQEFARKLVKAGFKPVDVVASLLESKSFDGVISNLGKV